MGHLASAGDAKMTRGPIIATLLGGLTAACAATIDQVDQRGPGADLRARAYAYCKSLGVNPGSDAYVLCRQRIDASASLDEAVWRRTVGDKRALEQAVKAGALRPKS
jgi:hypothetical protein